MLCWEGDGFLTEEREKKLGVGAAWSILRRLKFDKGAQLAQNLVCSVLDPGCHLSSWSAFNSRRQDPAGGRVGHLQSGLGKHVRQVVLTSPGVFDIVRTCLLILLEWKLLAVGCNGGVHRSVCLFYTSDAADDLSRSGAGGWCIN